MRHIREICIDINTEFDRFENVTGMQLEQLNVGAVPNDYTGDIMEVAFEKILMNLQRIYTNRYGRDEDE